MNPEYKYCIMRGKKGALEYIKKISLLIRILLIQHYYGVFPFVTI